MTLFVSRAERDAPGFFRRVRDAGVNVTGLPLIETEILARPADLAAAVRAGSYDGAIFTSPRAVRIFADLAGPAVTASIPAFICAGAGTAAAAGEIGLSPIVASRDAGQDGLIAHLSRQHEKVRPGTSYLFPRSQRADHRLTDWLASHGTTVVPVDLYRPVSSRDPAVRTAVAQLVSRPPDAFAFTSPSTVEAFLELARLDDPRAWFSGSKRLAIGASTARALIELTGGVEHVALKPGLNTLAELAAGVFAPVRSQREARNDGA